MCFAVNHSTHDTVAVEQALSKILPDVDHELGKVSVKLDDITEAIEETDKERKLADKAFTECTEKVQEIFEKRMKQMQEAQEELQQKIKNQQEFQVCVLSFGKKIVHIIKLLTRNINLKSEHLCLGDDIIYELYLYYNYLFISLSSVNMRKLQCIQNTLSRIVIN